MFAFAIVYLMFVNNNIFFFISLLFTVFLNVTILHGFQIQGGSLICALACV